MKKKIKSLKELEQELKKQKEDKKKIFKKSQRGVNIFFR